MSCCVRAVLLCGSRPSGRQPCATRRAGPSPGTAKRVYTPADFARFAPKTAYDMLVQVPGFTIRSADQRARAWPGERERADQRPANRQQVGRRGRPAEAHVGGQRRPDRDRRCRQPRHRRAFRAGRQHRAEGARQSRRASSNGIRTSARITPSRSTSPDRSAIRARRGRSITPCRRRTSSGRGGLGGPIMITTATACSPKAATRSIIREYEQANLQAKFGLDGPGSSIGNLTLGYTPYWNPRIVRDRRLFVTGEKRSRTNVRPSSTAIRATSTATMSSRSALAG